MRVGAGVPGGPGAVLGLALACLPFAPLVAATGNSCEELTVWESSGGPHEAGGWTGRVLEVATGGARLREILVTFAGPKLAEEEAPWFGVEPLVPVPVALALADRSYSGPDLESLREELDGAGIAFFCRGAGEVIVTRESVETFLGIKAVAGTRTERRRMRYDLTEPSPSVEGSDQATSEKRDPAFEREAARVLEEAGKVLSRRAADLEPSPVDLAKLPLARGLLRTLHGLGSRSAPPELRSDLLVAAPVAPKDYLCGLASEVIGRKGRPRDLPHALRILGDHPCPEAAGELARLVKRGQAREPVAALGLRALLKADPEAARGEALRQLAEGGEPMRAPIGVFALTEPELRRELEALDLVDAAAIREARERVLRYLASSAREEHLRRAAATALRPPRSP